MFTQSERATFILFVVIITLLLFGTIPGNLHAADSNLVGCWNMDEGAGATVADSSGNGNTGSVVGASWTSNGKINSSLDFQSGNAHIAIPASSSLDFSGDRITIAGWINLSSLTEAYSTVIQRSNAAGTWQDWQLYAKAADAPTRGRPVFRFDWDADRRLDSDEQVQADISLAANTWYFVACTYDGTAMRIYIDGVLRGTTNKSGGQIPASTKPIWIGANDAWGEPFRGRIDEFYLFNRALTQSEIQALAAPGPQPPVILSQPSDSTVVEGQAATFSLVAAGTEPLSYQWQRWNGSAWSDINGATQGSYTTPACTMADNGAAFQCVVSNALDSVTSEPAELTVTSAPTLNPEAFYKFEETAGSTAADSSGNGNTGTVVGAVWTDSGKIGRALDFQSGNAHVAVPASASTSFNTNRMTVAGWVYLTSLADPYPTLIQRSNAAGNWLDLQIYVKSKDAPTPGRPVFRINFDGDRRNDADEQVQANMALAANTWYFIACTYDGTALRFYIDGTLSGTTNKTGGVIPNSGRPIWIGANDAWGEPYRGRLDEICLFNRALSQTEIQALMAPGPQGPSITQQPTDQTVTEGQSATFNIAATGDAPLAYQWQRLSGATWNNVGTNAASYICPPCTIADNGAQFRCVVSNTAGDATSNIATLTVNAIALPPSITQQPTNQTVTEGQSATFNITATGDTPLSYQWQRLNGAAWNNVGTNAASYVCPPCTTADNGAQFRCVVSNTAGDATSNVATLTVNAIVAPPSITQQPTDQTVTEGQSATFNIAATGDAPLSYQWQRLNGAAWNNVGTNATSYVCPPCTIADNGAQFRCVVSNAAGDATSNIATLTVNAIALPPSITQQPTNQTVTEGQSATFNIAATGDAPLAYQWQRLNGATWNNVGTNAASYVCPPCTIADNGAQFRCVVSNAAGDATSNIATLTVNAIPGPSPQGFWKFSEGTGSTTADFSGNGNNGSVVGAAWTTGRVGPALDFQTGDAHVAVPASSSLDFATNRMTIACWVYPSSTTAGWSTIIQRSNAAGTWMDWQIYAKANDAPTAGRPVFRFDWDGDRRLDADEQVQADIALATNTWQFIACTYDGAALRFYIDGVLRGTTNKTGGIIPASTKPIWIGANDIWGEPYRGRIDEVRLFNQALTQTEIQSLMAVPNTASITINKMTLPAGASGFAFTGTNGIGDFVLDDADSQTFGNLPPGDYSITEHATSGWYLDSATCTGSLADGIAGGLLVHLGVSDQAICTFTNVEGSAAIFREHFNTNFTVGSTVGQNPNWYDAGGGPVVNASNGLGGTRGLAPASNIFSWKAHPFNWNAPEFSQFVVGMDFQSDSSGQFDDDRVGWMTTITSVDSANFFGVQLDTVTDGGIVSYWRDASGTRVQEPIVPFTSVKASTWYRLMVVITKLTPTSASVDVAMQELDAGGNPVGAPVTGSIVNTSNWSGGAAPDTDYFTATTAYPAFKNHSALSGAADNAYAEIVSGPLPTGTLTVNIVGNGSVIRNPDKTEYEWGEQVQLTAVPVAPQTFVGWSSGLTGSTNPATVVMLGNLSVTATFAEPQPPQILVNPANQSVYVGQSATFSVQASGTAPLQYQWQRDDVDIAGANAASYVCPPCDLDDNGATFCCVVSNAVGSVTSNDAVLTVTDAPPATFRETFNTGFTAGSTVGAHADWYDSSGGPVVTANVGVGGSVGLEPANNIFTWNAHPFNWNDSSFVGVNFGMDFQSNASGQFDDDRVGWMTTIANVDSANNFGVQLDTVTDGGLVTYWRDASGTRIQQPIIPFTSVKANTWYRLVMNITKLTSTSARIDVSLQELDASGNPVGTPLTGSIADTSNWSGGAGPAASYFASATYYPAYKNYTNAAGAADNAYAEVTETNNPANYTLNVSLSGSGSVQKNPDKPQYSAGEIVQLTAVPAAGWDFDSWSGDVSGSTNPISITMDGNKSVIATFSEVPTVPSFSIQPVNQTVTVGEAATFSVAASGTQPIAYQWMKWNGAAWEDVQNETGTSFTTAPTTLADDGARFCCEATNIMGTTTSNEAVLTVSPEANKALDFGGTNSFVTFGNNSALGLATFTLECWFRRDGTGVTTSTGTGGVTNAIPLVTKGRGEADGSNVDVNYFMGIRASDNVLAADFEEGVGGTTLGLNHPIVGTTPIANNTWYHAAATYDGSKWQLFLNGRLESELIVNLPPRSDSVQHSAIASALTSTGSAAGYFDGAIDEVRIWNYARTPAEIAALVNVPIATAQPGLVARWGLNEGSGAAVASTAGITANGSISGSNYAWIDGAPFNLPIATAPHPPELIAPADGAQNAGTSPQLEVRVTDPDADDMDVTFYGRAVSTEPNFTIAVLPDTQFYSANMNGGTAAMFTAQTQWIADNREEANIAFVAHVGDVSQNGDSAQAEWVNASNAMYLLDGLVPYGLAMGNHDQPGSYFNQYFGVAKFSGQPFYGGHYGTDNDNNYELFSAGGLDFIVIHLEYDDTPEAPVLAWADGLLKANPSRRGILVSHWLSEPGTNGAWGAPGQTIYNDLKDNPNLFLMLCGHRAGEGRRSDVFDGNTVHTLLADYQERTNGGNGWMRLMEFSPANNEIRIKTYSPTLGQYETDADSQFTLPYDLQNGSFEILGANLNVASGATTGIAWTGLADNASYQWFAVADDGTSVAASPSWTFSTGGTPQPTGVLETFDSGFTLNSPVGNHAEWYDAGGGPQIQSGIGLSGSNGVATSGNIFSWDAHPFTWGDAGFESLTVQMDFQSNGSGQFDDDRIGWMTTVTNVDSANNFGVQLDTSDGGIVTYWRTATGTRIQTPIAPLSGIVANTWYRFQATFTKLTATSARIDVALQQLDSGGNAVGTPITGTVSDTSLWAAGAPAATYFSSAAQYPAFKNYTAITGAADNAYIEISAQP